MKRDIKEYIEELLTKKEYYPLTLPIWNSFTFVQRKAQSKHEFQINLNIIESKVKDKKGIYVYKNINDDVLYIGKGNPLKSRMKSHYSKLMKVNSVSKRDAFFQKNQGVMTIFWLEIEEVEERELIEHLLSYLLNPVYKKWRVI